MINGVGAAFTAYRYNFADYFDPHYASCINGQANPQNDSILQNAYSGQHNDYFLYITTDEGGNVGAVAPGPDFATIGDDGVKGDGPSAGGHVGWVTLATAPTQAANSTWNVSSYPDQEVYSKVKFADLAATEYSAQDCTGPGTPFAACTGTGIAASGSVDPSCMGSPLASYCMGDKYIGSGEVGYATSRLNVAWNSTYTTLSTSDSNCTSNLAECLIGNGACTASSTPYTWCTGAGTGNAVTYASWGTGTGLLDENGLCPARGGCWMGDDIMLTGETTAMQADMSAYLTAYASQYFSASTKAFHTYEAGIPLQMIVGGWGSPPRREILKAATVLDLPQLTVPEYCANCADMQNRIDFVEQYLGNKPWITWDGFFANPDSSESKHVVTDNIATTQPARGGVYQQTISTLLNAKDSATGTYHVVGFYWWDMFDMDSEGLNWGLLSVNDNPYDGCSATISGCGLDHWGYPTGGEMANYGDVLDYVINANNSVFTNMAP
jgi:hypothetical protein